MFRKLSLKDIEQAVELDALWFGENGVTHRELEKLVTTVPSNTIGLFDTETLLGFAAFEILPPGERPKNYTGFCIVNDKTLFIQQFTTQSNYKKSDSHLDSQLLTGIEKIASENHCLEIWEALSIEHPYSAAKNPDFDAFGFYDRQGYTVDESAMAAWEPNETLKIPCFVFRKVL